MTSKIKKKPSSLHLLSRNMYVNPIESGYYEKLLRVNRHNPRALYQLGRKAEKAGDREKAKQYYEKSASVASYEPAIGALILLKHKEIQEERQREQKLRQASNMFKKWENTTARKNWRRRTMVQSLIIMLLIYLITITLVMGILSKYSISNITAEFFRYTAGLSRYFCK
ncbi:hypothetical protein PP175_23450 [Aneurinibacillus sp. Ricciae_BoGa-3]|uniref:hypothetical protein n=1 Tax=Aneurinibacillus sp. Ricciae_BoGa-3 TaxID=3022697 RepID=UPI002342252F|nr:hypothetical protein [Aneurinibacillus sp. Ricciae_BoGa-3]WCK54208.1 hypothetical protein PP175_23450 [Aneurinibacillus sp. Ricciae_BoGa-3]